MRAEVYVDQVARATIALDQSVTSCLGTMPNLRLLIYEVEGFRRLQLQSSTRSSLTCELDHYDDVGRRCNHRSC
jgi:hypothetical protein